MFETLKYEVKEGIGYITVNRPEALNALNSTVIGELYDCFAKAEADEEVKVIILTGEGRSFVAGADIAEMSKLNTIEARAFAAKGHRTMNFIEQVKKPVIAAVNGFALGGGCELSMACDFIVASKKAKFGQPEVGLGLIPGFGGTQRLARNVGKGVAKYLVYTAEVIDAEEAYRIGLATKVTEPEELIPTCEAIAKTIMSKAPIAVSIAKNCIDVGYNLDMPEASELEVNCFGLSFSSEDMKEGTSAFLEKRAPEFKNR